MFCRIVYGFCVYCACVDTLLKPKAVTMKAVSETVKARWRAARVAMPYVERLIFLLSQQNKVNPI